MTWLIKKVQVFFLFIAVCVLNAHMMIPHDHHQADSDLCHDYSYPPAKNTGSHHSGLPSHCHAFNDMASEKAILIQSIKYFPSHDFIPGHIPDNGETGIPYYCIRNYEIVNLRVSDSVHKLVSLRAPPSLG